MIFAAAWFAMSLTLQTHSATAATRITEPEHTGFAVYVKAGDALRLRCVQTNGYTVQWYHRRDHDRYDPIDTGAMNGFYTVEERNGEELINLLLKDSVDAEDSGFYQCQVQSALDETASVKVYIVFMQEGDDVMTKHGISVMLNCTFSSPQSWVSPSLTWHRHGVPLTTGLRYTVTEHTTPNHAAITSLKIAGVGEEDIGQYVCRATVTEQLIFNHFVNIFSFPHIRAFERSKSVPRGQTLQLECRVSGWPTPNVTWWRNGEPLNATADERVSFPTDTGRAPGVIFRLSDVQYADRANYTCVAASLVDGVVRNYSATVLIRVKDNLAALWPSIGILLEVIILSAVIYVYEKRRAEQRAADQLAEANDHVVNSVDHKDTPTRLRK